MYILNINKKTSRNGPFWLCRLINVHILYPVQLPSTALSEVIGQHTGVWPNMEDDSPAKLHLGSKPCSLVVNLSCQILSTVNCA